MPDGYLHALRRTSVTLERPVPAGRLEETESIRWILRSSSSFGRKGPNALYEFGKGFKDA